MYNKISNVVVRPSNVDGLPIVEAGGQKVVKFSEDGKRIFLYGGAQVVGSKEELKSEKFDPERVVS